MLNNSKKLFREKNFYRYIGKNKYYSNLGKIKNGRGKLYKIIIGEKKVKWQ